MSALDAERHESAQDSEPSSKTLIGWAVVAVLCGFIWAGLWAGLCWLLDQPDEVIVKIAGGVALLLGSALVGEALAHLERAK